MDFISIREEGTVKEIKNAIVKIEGFSNCRNGQLVNFSDNAKGLIMGFNEKEVLVLFLGNVTNIKVGERVYTEGEAFKIPVGEGFLGRVVNALCEPLDSIGKIESNDYYSLFRDAPAVLDRVPIYRMFETGIRIIDSSIPIGKGQRELILGDRITGKSTVCVDSILNQKGKGVICIYCCIGNAFDALKKNVHIFKEKGALDYSIVVSAPAASTTGEKYLAPYTAAALGEYFMYSGKDVFVVFDDLTKHAWAYRELSLLLERPPGREAYPGDIFYIHSQLVERAAQLNKELGAGSMTFFPIADTLEGDISGFIPTNLISMTDGQIYLDTVLFNEGFRPAIDLGLSVSRIGSKILPAVFRKLTQDLRLQYLQYRKLIEETKLKEGVTPDELARLRHGDRVRDTFIQSRNNPSSLAKQILLFFALREGLIDKLNISEYRKFEGEITDFVKEKFPDTLDNIETKQLDAALIARFKEAVEAYFTEKNISLEE